MTDQERIEAANQRYFRAAHAMQSATAFEMGQNPKPTEPKHLRVGINSAMVNDLALAKLLIAKGIFTEVEYHEAIAQAMEDEVKRYEASYPGVTFA